MQSNAGPIHGPRFSGALHTVRLKRLSGGASIHKMHNRKKIMVSKRKIKGKNWAHCSWSPVKVNSMGA